MNTADMLFQKYGSPVLSMDQLAEVLHFKSGKVLLDAISAERCKVPTFKQGKKRLALVNAVAKYLDAAAVRDDSY